MATKNFTNTLWFNNPDDVRTITDKAVQTKIRGMCMTATVSKHDDLIYDFKLSQHLKNEVFYMAKSKRSLINYINQKCNFNIDPNIPVLAVDILGDTFILASTQRRISDMISKHGNDYLYAISTQIQAEYFIRHDIEINRYPYRNNDSFSKINKDYNRIYGNVKQQRIIPPEVVYTIQSLDRYKKQLQAAK